MLIVHQIYLAFKHRQFLRIKFLDCLDQVAVLVAHASHSQIQVQLLFLHLLLDEEAKFFKYHHSLWVLRHPPINNYLLVCRPDYCVFEITYATQLGVRVLLVQNFLYFVGCFALFLKKRALHWKLLLQLIFFLIIIVFWRSNDVEEKFKVCDFVVDEVVIAKVLELTWGEHIFGKLFTRLAFELLQILFLVEVFCEHSVGGIFIFIFVDAIVGGN